MESIDQAFIDFEKIVGEIAGYSHTIFSEQDSRVKVIDRILTEVLGYSFADISTEPHSEEGYLDYLVSQDGVGKMVIEAKKDGLDFRIDGGYSGRSFVLNGPVFSDKTVKDGLNQAILYAAHESLELGCLTNGRTWIVFRTSRLGDGKKVLSGKGFVFGDLDGVRKNFKLFYELLAPENIRTLKFRALFAEAEGREIRTKAFAKSLKTEETIRLAGKITYSADFDRVMNSFFSKLTGDNDPDMIRKCFVETKESKAADYQLTKISQELISDVKSIDTSDGEILSDIILRIKQTNRQEFVMLVGAKGAGKSTYVERFFNDVLSEGLKQECIVVRLNVGEFKGSEAEIINWLDINLLEECERNLYCGAPTIEEIQGIFFEEYKRLSIGTWGELYKTDKNQFKIDFGRHIEERRERRPTEYIKRLIGDIVRSRKKVPCVVFDNTDHFSINIQQDVFQYARSIYEKEICLVILPITDRTSWELAKQGAIQSYESEVLFLPTPSPQKIIERRIEYLNDKVASESRVKGDYFLNRGIKIQLQDIEAFVRYLQLIFLADRRTAKWIGAFANYDIRRTLDFSKDLIASPHLSLEEFLKVFVEKKNLEQQVKIEIKPYKIKNALIKKKYTSYPINHHSFIQNMFYCTGDVNTSPLLGLRILQVLNDVKQDRATSDKTLSVDQLLDYFSAMGIDRTITTRHLQFLLEKGLILSYDPTVLEIEVAKMIEISPAGVEHYMWCLNDTDYAFAMLEVTPIADRGFFSEIESSYNYHGTKYMLTISFLNYLLREDEEYCHVPQHESYRGQLLIKKRFNWSIQLLQRYSKHRDN